MPETGFEFYLGSHGNSLTFHCLIGQLVNSVSHVRAFSVCSADFRQSINNSRSIAEPIEKLRFTTITCHRLLHRWINSLALINFDSIYTSATNRSPLLCIPIEPSKSTDLHCVRTCANWREACEATSKYTRCVIQRRHCKTRLRAHSDFEHTRNSNDDKRVDAHCMMFYNGDAVITAT